MPRNLSLKRKIYPYSIHDSVNLYRDHSAPPRPVTPRKLKTVRHRQLGLGDSQLRKTAIGDEQASLEFIGFKGRGLGA